MAGRPEDRAPRLDNPSEAGVLPDTQEGRDEGRGSSAAQTWRWVDDVLLVVALIPLAPVIFVFWLATRKADYDLFI